MLSNDDLQRGVWVGVWRAKFAHHGWMDDDGSDGMFWKSHDCCDSIHWKEESEGMAVLC